jgi:hypothetical protein
MKRISLNKVMAKLAEQPEKVELSVWDKLKNSQHHKAGYKFMDAARDLVLKAQGAFSDDIKEAKENLEKVKELQAKAKEIGADDYASSMDSALKTLKSGIESSEMEMKSLEKAFQALR